MDRRLLVASLVVGAPAASIALAAFVGGGCVSTVEPPTNLARPVTVFLRSEAAHSGVLLPHPGRGFVEYGYGDYDWYALEKNRWYDLFDTALWPTRGTLGRRVLPSETPEALEASYPFSTLLPIAVEADEAARLERRLEHRYREAASEAGVVYNPTADMFFVEHHGGFWLLHNCHDATAEWLSALGCSVSRAPVRRALSLRTAR